MPRVTALGETDGQLARDPDARAARLPARRVRGGPGRAGRRAPGAGAGAARAATCPGWPARAAGSRPAAGTAPARWRWPAAGRPGAGRAAALPLVRARRGRVPLPACGGAPAAGRRGRRRPDRRGAGPGVPGQPVRRSGGGAPVLAAVPARPALVVATPGAEPAGRRRLRRGAAARRLGAAGAGPTCGWPRRPCAAGWRRPRWCVPHADGGRVVVMADAAEPVVQALVRWDPAGHAAAELAGRAEVGFPPAVRMAAVEGSAGRGGRGAGRAGRRPVAAATSAR